MKGPVVVEGFTPSPELELYEYTAEYAPGASRIDNKRILIRLTGTLKATPHTALLVLGNALNMRVDNNTPIVASGTASVWFMYPGQSSTLTDCY